MPKTEGNPYLKDVDGKLAITKAGYAKLNQMCTDSTGQVYAFKPSAVSPVIVAAAMARLSRRAGDMRLCILDEFATVNDDSQAEKLIERVVTGYGDDSVQQLITMQFVVEQTSNLMTKLLEWGRFGAYLEQSTRYIFFDEPGSDGKYLYYTPKNLPAKLAKRYNQDMDTIFANYSKIVRQLTDYLRKKHPEPEDKKELIAWRNSTRATACDAARSLLPAATKSTVGIMMSSQTVEQLVIRLLGEPLEEAQRLGQAILGEARKIVPAFLKRADQPERGGAMTAYRATIKNNLTQLAQELKEPTEPVNGGVKLISVWPENELDLAAELLFEGSSLSLEEIKTQLAKWPKQKLEQVLLAAIGTRLNRRHRPGRAIEKAHFEWEIVGDYGTFRDLQRHRVVDAFEWQKLHPRFGHDIPDLIKEAGFSDLFEECFATSSALYTLLANSGFALEAQYATLFGHKMRYRFLTNLREAFHLIELRTGPDGHPGYRKICNQMFELLRTKYPRFAKAMQFVNQREDPALVRLAAEMATQFKLEKLG